MKEETIEEIYILMNVRSILMMNQIALPSLHGR
jgi:hypothetical protein